jgi:structural maintenance of chromosome 2
MNGHKVTQQQVLSFFQAVSLNINNPNFLIMQGRITKVLNMRPAEVLGMIEEAAGTRMFEEKKDKARKTMVKKQSKVDEITDILHTEIEPKLNKLRIEKKNYIQYQKSAAELEKVGRILRAWEYSDNMRRVKEKEEEMEEKKAERKEVEAEMKRAQKEGQQAEKDMSEVVKKRDAEMKKGGKLAKLKAEADALGKDVVKVRTQAEIKQGTIEEEEQRLIETQAQIQDVRGFCRVSRPFAVFIHRVVVNSSKKR